MFGNELCFNYQVPCMWVPPLDMGVWNCGMENNNYIGDDYCFPLGTLENRILGK